MARGQSEREAPASRDRRRAPHSRAPGAGGRLAVGARAAGSVRERPAVSGAGGKERGAGLGRGVAGTRGGCSPSRWGREFRGRVWVLAGSCLAVPHWPRRRAGREGPCELAWREREAGGGAGECPVPPPPQPFRVCAGDTPRRPCGKAAHPCGEVALPSRRGRRSCLGCTLKRGSGGAY